MKLLKEQKQMEGEQSNQGISRILFSFFILQNIFSRQLSYLMNFKNLRQLFKFGQINNIMLIDGLKEQVIISSLLGDAYINKDNRYEGYTFTERHSLKQIDYLIWKNKYLNFNFKKYEKHNICLIRKSHKFFKNYKAAVDTVEN